MRDEWCPTTSHAWVAADLQEEFFDAMAMGGDDCDSVNGNPDEVDNVRLGMRPGSVFCAFLWLFLTFFCVVPCPFCSSFSLRPAKEHVRALFNEKLCELAVSACA